MLNQFLNKDRCLSRFDPYLLGLLDLKWKLRSCQATLELSHPFWVLWRGELLFQVKTDGTAPSMYVNRPIPWLFLRCSYLKWREQTFVESVIEKCLPVSCRIACSHFSLKHFSVGMLKNPTSSPFTQLVAFWLQSGTQQYRFCGDLLLFIAKTSTKNNNNLNYTAYDSVS